MIMGLVLGVLIVGVAIGRSRAGRSIGNPGLNPGDALEFNPQPDIPGMVGHDLNPGNALEFNPQPDIPGSEAMPGVGPGDPGDMSALKPGGGDPGDMSALKPGGGNPGDPSAIAPGTPDLPGSIGNPNL